MSIYLTRQSFGLPAHPWERIDLATADSARAAALVAAAVGHIPRSNRDHAQGMVSILGPRGAGKTRAVKAALDRFPTVRVVELLRSTRERAHMGDIEEALIRDLSNVPPRRGGEARTRQLRWILGEAQDTQPVVLVIDDAHTIHSATLRGLKRLRELGWKGRRTLLGVIMMGQRDSSQNIDEIRLRSDRVWLEGLTQAEAKLALEQAVGSALEPDALQALAAAPAPRRTWLDLQCAVDQALALALAAGHHRVTLADAVQATGAGLQALAQASGISQAEIARQVGSSETTVSRLLRGEREDPKLQDRITDLLLGGAQQPAARRAAGGA